MNENQACVPSDGLPLEEWRPVVGYEGHYEVSSLGDIKSVKRCRGASRTPRILKKHLGSSGYEFVVLRKDGVNKNATVHRMVARAFVPKPDGKDCVNHKDGNKLNNNAQNLEWVTYSENAFHSMRTLGNAAIFRSFDEQQIIAIRSDDRPQSAIARDFGVCQTLISQIKTGKIYKEFGGKIESHPCVKENTLTEEQIVAIRNSTDSLKIIAEQFGVSKTTVWRIRTGQRHSDV